MCRAVREVHVKVVDFASGKQIGEIAGVSSAHCCLDLVAIFLLVCRDERLGPSILSANFFLPELQDRLRWRVMNLRLQPAGMWMSNARERGMDRAARKSKSQTLERERLRVAKSLRENGITRIEVCEPHVRISESGNPPQRESKTLSFRIR